MNEEVMRILKMVEEGKISSEKAKDLIDALNQSNNKEPVQNYEDKFLRIKVNEVAGDRVNVQL
ncbi:MAG: SHOCT-like domain-containing protein, partial [Clostridium sp.]